MSKAVDSIDDILNASDSDEGDDNLAGAGDVDLETLLEEDDDDPPVPTSLPVVVTRTPAVLPKSSVTPTTALSKSAIDIEKLISGDDDDEAPPVNAKLSIEKVQLPVNLNYSVPTSKPKIDAEMPFALPSSLKLMTLDQTISEVERDEESTFDNNESLSSLALADKREHKFLMAGVRDVISALQAKRRRDDSANSNNLKCVEMDAVSTQLRKNSSFRNHGPGVATVVSIHAKFIAVGTSRGLILLFDHEQEIRQVIGSAVGATARCTAAVSAIDINSAGSMLVCGYDSGEVALWDVVKGSLLKRVTDVHSFPVCRLRILASVSDGYQGPGAGAGISSSSEIFAISVDVRGSVHRIKISKMLWTSYVSEAECLLDGSAGSVTDMDILPPFQPLPALATENWGSQVGFNAGNQFIAINSLTRSLIVQIHPSIKIRYRWPSPPSAQDPVSGGVVADSVASIAWSWANSSECVFAPTTASDPSSSPSPYGPPPSLTTHYPLLARPWGNFVQVIMVYPIYQGGKEEGYQTCLLSEKNFGNTKFIGVKWLSQGTSMALITLSEVYIVRRNLETIEVCSMLPALCASMKTMYDARMSLDQAIRAVAWVFSQKLYMLSPEALYIFHIQSWKEIVDQLIISGNWLDALAIAIENFRKELNNNPNADRSTIHRYIKKYVDLAISQSANSGASVSRSSSGQQRNHFHLVAGVCIEYCVMAGSVDMLFNDLFQMFKAIRQESVFLEELEPYLLKREIKSLPQHILTAFTDSCTREQKFSALERCVMYLDLENSDIDELASRLEANKLISGLLYARAFKSGDFAEAFSATFSLLLASASASGTKLSSEGFPSLDQARIGHKLLLFCKYVADNKLFPRGDAYMSSIPQIGVLAEFILSTKSHNAIKLTDFPILMPLSQIDASGTVYCAMLLLGRLARCTKDNPFPIGSMYSTLYSFVRIADETLNSGQQLQSLYFSYAMEQLTTMAHPLSPTVLAGVVQHCSKEFKQRKEAEDLMFGLAMNQSKFPEVAGPVRDTLVRFSFWKALLGMHNRKQFCCTKQEFESAIKFYCSLKLSNSSSNNGSTSGSGSNSALAAAAAAMANKGSLCEEIVFDYISAQFTAYSMDLGSSVSEKAEIMEVSGGNGGGAGTGLLVSEAKKVLAKHLVELFSLNEQRTQRLACQYLTYHVGDIIASTAKNLPVQFSLLKAIIHDIKEDSEREIGDYVSSTDMLTYIRLLLSFSSDDAFKFLSSTSHYPLDEALALCREKEVLDASAYLLERAGDAAGALTLLCTDISRRIQTAKSEIDALLRTESLSAGRRPSTLTSMSTLSTPSVLPSLSKADITRNTLHQILQADKQSSARQELAATLPFYAKLLHVTDLAASICSRHCTRSETGLWFSTFDHLLKERQNTRVSKSSTAEIVTVLVGMILHAFMANMQGMIPPQEIIRRVTAQQTQGTGSRFGEFKDVMVSMVDTYAHDVFLNELLKRLHVADLFALHKKKYLRTLMGEKVDVEEQQEMQANATVKVKDAVLNRAKSATRRRRYDNRANNLARVRDVLRQTSDSNKGGQYTMSLDITPPFFYDPSIYDGEVRRKSALPKVAQYQASYMG